MSRIEVKNRNDLTNLLLDNGYNVFLPVVDEGIDLVAHRESDNDVKLIQLKARWGIWRKYAGRGIYIAFRYTGRWYCIPHDLQLTWPETQTFQLTSSWIDKGQYHVPAMSKALSSRCEGYILT